MQPFLVALEGHDCRYFGCILVVKVLLWTEPGGLFSSYSESWLNSQACLSFLSYEVSITTSKVYSAKNNGSEGKYITTDGESHVVGRTCYHPHPARPALTRKRGTL